MWRDLIRMWRRDNLLGEAWNESFQMLEIDQEMFLEALRILRESDTAAGNREVLRKDARVDAYQQEVRRKLLTHCAFQGAAEMPQSMVLVTLVIDLERIGDYIKNMVNLAANHPQRLQGGRLESDLRRVEDAVKENFVRTRTCLESPDEPVATKVLEETRWISEVCDAGLLSLVKGEDTSLSSAQAVSLALYIRWLKRINSHLGDIATSVVNPFDRIGFKPKGDDAP